MTRAHGGGGTWAVVVAGGNGRRFGAMKQFESLGERPMVTWAIDAARSVASGVVLVVPAEVLDDPSWREAADVVVAGGKTRAESVRAGLAAVPVTGDIIIVHDAARPLASAELFRSVVNAVEQGADGAIPGLLVNDTIKRVVGGRVVETLERSELIAVQTPQAFIASVLRHAHESAAEATDDAALVEAIGGIVVVVPGERRNVKVTDRSDLAHLATVIGDEKALAP